MGEIIIKEIKIIDAYTIYVKQGVKDTDKLDEEYNVSSGAIMGLIGLLEYHKVKRINK
jgi:hypothetical protein